MSVSANTGRFDSAQIAATNNGSTVSLDAQQDAFWTYPTQIDELRWDQSYPYQLVLYKKNGTGGYDRRDGTAFTLPIPPQDLVRDIQPAITTTVTLGGIIEEHNGAPLRPMTFTGTTGVLPLRASGPITQQRNLGEAIFGGTLQGVSQLTNNVLVATQGPQTLYKQNLINNQTDIAQQSGDLYHGTGYFQFRMLERWFENYLALKKRAEGRDYVMAVEIHKEEAAFLVTPAAFSLRRNAASPMEFSYVLSFRAWRRFVPNLASGTANFVSRDVTADPNAFAQLLTRLSASRRALTAASASLAGVRADVNAVVFEPLRQIVLFAKDALGVAISAADLPVNIVKDMRGPILEAASVQVTVNQVNQAWSNLSDSIDDVVQQTKKQIESFSVTSGKAETQSATLVGYNQAAIASSADPANKILSNPQDNFDFFDLIQPSQLNLSPELNARIDNERENSRELTRLDFETYRDQLITFAADYADSVGAGSATYNSLFGRPAPTSTRTPTDQDFQVLEHLNNSIIELNRLAATSSKPATTQNVMQYVAALASPAGITFNIPSSKVAVPFPYGYTLEMLAVQYLSDATRWLEIATLNNLQAPYVDEEGFDLALLVPAGEHTVTVSDASNLYVGQTVWLSATNTSRTSRTIDAVTQVGTSYVLTLDGDPDLARFTPAGSATLHAFLPNTVNSQQVVFIPSMSPAQEPDLRGKPDAALAQLERQLVSGGIDLLLTQSGDLALTSDGNCPMAIGYTNSLQRVRIAFDTPQGSVPLHPTFGLPVQVGQSVADLSAQQILQASTNLFQGDSSIVGVRGVDINIAPPGYTVDLTVQLAGITQYLPVRFQLNR